MTISCSFWNVEDMSEWTFAGVSRPIVTMLGCFFGMNWRSYELVDHALVYQGDFNVSHFPCVKSGAACICPPMSESSYLTFEQNLIDMSMVG